MPAATADTVQDLCNVLLVEDDADTRDVMSRLLQSAGYPVRGTSMVGEALLLMEYHLPSHILLDLSLPDAGGVVLLALRASPAAPRTHRPGHRLRPRLAHGRRSRCAGIPTPSSTSQSISPKSAPGWRSPDPRHPRSCSIGGKPIRCCRRR